MSDITKIKVDGEPESSYKIFSKNREFEKRAESQPDWNQNDATKPDYVKNRPFYTGDPKEDVLFNGSFVFTIIGMGPMGERGVYNGVTDFSPEIGQTYQVSWDGAVYSCVGTEYNSLIALGNLSIMNFGSDTGEPFLMALGTGSINIYTHPVGSSHTISIGKMVAPVVKIDPKYLAQPDWNQNDSTASDYVKNRTHYDESIYTDYVLNMSGTKIVGLSLPEVGETMTVKINGVESAETVKEAESSSVGVSYKYIGNIDLDSLQTGGTGWLLVAESSGQATGFANPDTTITVEIIVVHKINNKFINFDGLVRTFDYHFKDFMLYKHLYNDAGDECVLYTSIDFILPDEGSLLFGFMSELGFSQVGKVYPSGCFIRGFIITNINDSVSIRVTDVILGTDTSYMEAMAADAGYTHTTNPNA